MTIEYIIPKKKTNINEFIKKYKNKTFTIKNDKMKMEIEVKLNKIKSIINSKLDFYSLTTVEKSAAGAFDGIEYVFAISFFYKTPSYENVNIDNISKSEKYSGSNIVKFVIDFLSSLKQVKKVYVKDGSQVSCKNSDDRIDLSMYKLLTSYNGFYQKLGFRLVIENGEKDITKIMVSLAKKVSNYKVKDILENFREIIRFVEKYKQKIIVKYIGKYEKILYEKSLDNLKDFIYDFGFLYFSMLPYKNYTFGKYLEKMNSKKCFILSKLFEILSNNYYFNFSYNKKEIISHFLLDYIKLSIYRNNYQWKGIFMKKIE
jgi:hypothetical protein